MIIGHFPVDIRKETLTIRYPTGGYETGQLSINLPDAISQDGLTIPRLRKLFKLFIEWRGYFPANKTSMQALELYIADYAEACKDAKELALTYYGLNKQDPAAITGKTKDAKSKRKAIKDKNAELLKEVRLAEKKYERSEKVKALWNELAEQYVM